MNQFTEKEKVFFERLKKKKISISDLAKRLELLFIYVTVYGSIFPILALKITFVIGEKPKIYHILCVPSFAFATLAIYEL